MRINARGSGKVLKKNKHSAQRMMFCGNCDLIYASQSARVVRVDGKRVETGKEEWKNIDRRSV